VKEFGDRNSGGSPRKRIADFTSDPNRYTLCEMKNEQMGCKHYLAPILEMKTK